MYEKKGNNKRLTKVASLARILHVLKGLLKVGNLR